MPGTIKDLTQAGHRIQSAQHQQQQAAREVAAQIGPARTPPPPPPAADHDQDQDHQ